MLDSSFSQGAQAGKAPSKSGEHVAKLAPLTLIISKKEFDDWLKSATKNSAIIYAVGLALPRKNPVCEAIGQLARDGALALTQRPIEQPVGPRKFEYCARRLADPPPKRRGAPKSRNRSDLEGTIEGKILAEIARAANFGRPCPSYTELARALDLPSREIARYRVNRLVDLGFIEVRPERQNQRRVVRIISTGKMTKRSAV